jgi:hypothetical protein
VTPSELANSAGALVTAGLGVMALVSPPTAAAFTSMSPVGKLGVSEIRATYGGFFLALGAYALWSQHEAAYAAAGIAWSGAALGRVVSVFVDQSREAKNLGGIAFEGAIAMLLLA